MDELRLAFKTGNFKFSYKEDFGPSRTSYLSIVGDEVEGKLRLSIFVEIQLPHLLIEFDSDGMKAILEEYRRGLIAIKTISYLDDEILVSELEEQESFHGDMVSYEVPIDSPEEAIAMIKNIRKSIGLKEPLTMIGLESSKRMVFLEMVNKIVTDITDFVVGNKKNRDLGWVSLDQIVRKLGVRYSEVEIGQIINALLERAYIDQRVDGMYRARLGTGALLEALSESDNFYSCLLWPYALGYTHSGWRIFYKDDEECLKLHEKIVEIERSGFFPFRSQTVV